MENTIHFEQVQVSSYGNIPMTFFFGFGILEYNWLICLSGSNCCIYVVKAALPERELEEHKC